MNIALDLKNIRPDGLPIKKESNIANKFEDKLLDGIGNLATVQYIGHFYNDSFLDIYVYIDRTENANEYLQAQANKKDIIRGFATKLNKFLIGLLCRDF